MCKSLPFISSILLSRSLNDKPIGSSFLFPLHHKLVNRFACDFFERSHSRCNLDQSAAAQRNHAAFDCLLLQLDGGGADQNQFPDLVVHLHDFVQTTASLVPSVVADAAALAFLDLDRLRFLER